MAPASWNMSSVASMATLPYQDPVCFLFFYAGLIESGFKAPDQGGSISVSPEMHKKQSRFFIQHVIVQRRHFYSVFPQRFYNRAHFTGQKHEISVDCCLITVYLKIQRDVHTHVARDLGTFPFYMYILTGHVDV